MYDSRAASPAPDSTPTTAFRCHRPPANDEPMIAATIDMATMNVTEKWAPSRSQSLKLMPPHDLSTTATRKTGREKKTNVKNVTM